MGYRLILLESHAHTCIYGGLEAVPLTCVNFHVVRLHI